nr:hypothetical protein [Ruegeria marisrubri]
MPLIKNPKIKDCSAHTHCRRRCLNLVNRPPAFTRDETETPTKRLDREILGGLVAAHHRYIQNHAGIRSYGNLGFVGKYDLHHAAGIRRDRIAGIHLHPQTHDLGLASGCELGALLDPHDLADRSLNVLGSLCKNPKENENLQYLAPRHTNNLPSGVPNGS